MVQCVSNSTYMEIITWYMLGYIQAVLIVRQTAGKSRVFMSDLLQDTNTGRILPIRNTPACNFNSTRVQLMSYREI